LAASAGEDASVKVSTLTSGGVETSVDKIIIAFPDKEKDHRVTDDKSL